MIILLFILIILFFLLICLGLIVLSFFFDFRDSSGIILFKIDYNNKRVIRLNEKYHFLSTIFDSKKSKFDIYSFISLQDFLNFIAPNDRNKIEEYLANQEKRKAEYKIRVNTEYVKELNFFEKILVWFDKSILNNTPYKLTIHPIENNEYVCSIKWIKKGNHLQNKKLTKINNDKDIKLANESLVISFALNPHYYINNIDEKDLLEIANNFGLTSNKIKYFIREGMLFFIVKSYNTRYHKNLQEQIVFLNQNSFISKHFIAATYFLHTKVKEQDNIEQILIKSKYCLFNILANDQNEHITDYLNVPNDIIISPEFRLFVSNLEKYTNANFNQTNLEVDYSNLISYESRRMSDLAILKTNIANLEKEWNDFFAKIPSLNFLNEEKQLTFIKHAHGILKSKISISDTLIKISQEVFLNKKFHSQNLSPICLVYAYNNMFDYEKLKNKIAKNYLNKIPTALYIDKIDHPLFNVINTTKLKAIVLSENISKQIYDTKVFFDCINVVRLAKNNDIKLIYENPLDNLDPEIIQKAEVYIAYYTKDKTTQAKTKVRN
ncbi:MHO_4530 family protein [Mycoplasmopsis glycophila]|uniref:Uncharacterized protein n=1 Tax=Mycoplasmopsis glycophila TaxID=171285 RepID=A0A449AVA5_9BACT|nr:hypothetical protein [Mycoplasmopsis glycophila]VEU70423.1 Uncharacterised protein [Mycoplasmopsis glycophila]